MYLSVPPLHCPSGITVYVAVYILGLPGWLQSQQPSTIHFTGWPTCSVSHARYVCWQTSVFMVWHWPYLSWVRSQLHPFWAVVNKSNAG